MAVYEEALQRGATSALFDLYHAFLEEQLQRLLGEAQSKATDGSGKAALEWAYRLLAAYGAASDAGKESRVKQMV